MNRLEGWRKFLGMMICVFAITFLGWAGLIDGDRAADFIEKVFFAYVIGNLVADHLVKRIPKGEQV